MIRRSPFGFNVCRSWLKFGWYAVRVGLSPDTPKNLFHNSPQQRTPPPRLLTVNLFRRFVSHIAQRNRKIKLISFRPRFATGPTGTTDEDCRKETGKLSRNLRCSPVATTRGFSWSLHVLILLSESTLRCYFPRFLARRSALLRGRLSITSPILFRCFGSNGVIRGSIWILTTFGSVDAVASSPTKMLFG